MQFIALGAFIENLGYAAAADGYRLTVDELPIVPRRTAEITVRFRDGMTPGDNAASFLAAGQATTDEPRPVPIQPASRGRCGNCGLFPASRRPA